MNKMIERVARGLHDSEAAVLDNGLAPFERQPEGYRNRMCRRARAAIEAMREPTEAMISAGEATRTDCLDWSPEPGEGLDGFDPRPAWQAMVDAALKDADPRAR